MKNAAILSDDSRHLITYFILAYAISWSIGVPLALANQGIIPAILPQFFYLFDPTMAVGWVIGLFAGAVILTWLYNSANNSILMVAIWHACFNFMTASQTDTGILPVVLSTIIIVWAVSVIIRYKPKYLMSI